MCINRNVWFCFGLFLGWLAQTLVFTAVQGRIYHLTVEVWGLTPAMPAGLLTWHVYMNFSVFGVLVLCVLAYLLGQLVLRLEENASMQRRLEEVSRRIVELDVDDLPEPGPKAMELERRLFDVVHSVRLWKPYLPATLFLPDVDTETQPEILVSGPESGRSPRGVMGLTAHSSPRSGLRRGCGGRSVDSEGLYRNSMSFNFRVSEGQMLHPLLALQRCRTDNSTSGLPTAPLPIQFRPATMAEVRVASLLPQGVDARSPSITSSLLIIPFYLFFFFQFFFYVFPF